ncbi:MAG: RHS repeat protein [Breznakibacter sp.]
MKKRVLLFLLVMPLAIVLSYGQDVSDIEQQFNEKFVNRPYNEFGNNLNKDIDYHTGAANIAIPLHNVKIKNIIEIPIRLTYNTSGVKVPERPGPIGLGWNLNAGGFIKREIRGRSDDGSFRKLTWRLRNYSSSNSAQRSPTFDECKAYRGDPSTVRSVLFSGLADLASDVYHFSFGNISGSFVIDKNGNPHVLDQRPLIIKKNTINQSNYYDQFYFTIFDEKGNEYQFTKPSIVSSANQYKHDDPNDAQEMDKAYWLSDQRLNLLQYDLSLNKVEMCWYLTKIVCHQTSQAILFDYYTDDDSYKVPANTSINFYLSVNSQGTISSSQILRNEEVGSDFQLRQNNEFPDYMHTNANIVTIKSITTPFEKIIFKRSSTKRQDLPNLYSIESVEIKDLNDVSLKKFSFTQSYFISDRKCNSDASLCKRLKLESITESNGIFSKNPYVFYYDEANKMAGRDSYSLMDYYGYSIDPYEDNIGVIPNISFRSNNYNISKNIGLACNRQPVFPEMQAFALTDIEYPTGGRIHFEFEANEYYDDNSGTNKISGGLRIKRITESCSNCIDIVTNYSYNRSDNSSQSSGQIGAPPEFYREIKDASRYPGIDIWMIGSIWPVNDIGTTGGSHIGYTEVTESNPDNGKTIRRFTNFKDHPDLTNADYYNLALGSAFPSDFGYNTFILPKTRLNDERGLLTSIEYYNKSGTLIKKLSNTYNFDYLPSKKMVSENVTIVLARGNAQPYSGYGYFHPNIDFYIMNKYTFENNEDIAFVGRYYDVCKMVRLVQAIDSTFHNGSEVIVRKNYSYNNVGLLSEETIVNSNGSTILKNYKYPFDFSVISPYNAMVERNIIYPTIEQSEWNGDKHVQTKRTGYDVFSGGLINPVMVSVKNGSQTSSEIRLRYTSYDDHGNLTGIKNEDDIPVSYYWTNNQTHPVAMIENYDYASLEGNGPLKAKLAELETFTEMGGAAARAGLGQLNAEIRSLLPAMALATTYTYSPLVGITSSTGPSGRTVYYGYDAFGRLEVVRDQDGNILDKYEYRYATQP